MIAIMKKSRYFALIASVVATVAVLGCGGDESGLATRYKVSGKVTYKGEPVPKGTVVFEPSNPPLPEGRPANGPIENGSFTMTTANANDGAFPGEYKVVIISSDLDVSAQAKRQGGLLHQGDEEHQKALKAAKNLIPAKYNRSETSGLTAKVEKNNTNFFTFDLKDD